METCVADGDDDDDDDDKHRITINKSQIDTHVAAEGEKTLKDVLDGQIDKEPNDDSVGRVGLECAPVSSKDIRVELTSACPPRNVLEDAPEPTTARRLKTPQRKKANHISNTGVHDEQLFMKDMTRDYDVKGEDGVV